ncbi:MAG: hypothetical protein CM1200mP30_26750 [Pseudomonadota bacterium]|nr:MAG: hypothetical protein CM1200mP30_26750 [Pseudomonadota bacterium]
MSQDAIISFHDVSKSFGDVKAINSANFKIQGVNFLHCLARQDVAKQPSSNGFLVFKYQIQVRFQSIIKTPVRKIRQILGL